MGRKHVYCGIDPSLVELGIAFIEPEKLLRCLVMKTKRGILGFKDKEDNIWSNIARCREISMHVFAMVEMMKPICVCVELAAYGGGGKGRRKNMRSVRQMDMIQYAVHDALLRVSHDFEVVSVYPTSRAKFIAGSGKASKETVVEYVNKWSGMPGLITNDNGCDAIALARIAEAYSTGKDMKKIAHTTVMKTEFGDIGYYIGECTKFDPTAKKLIHVESLI